eukprot:scaffold13968_cov119-Isochrysis_galbana.AAC.2
MGDRGVRALRGVLSPGQASAALPRLRPDALGWRGILRFHFFFLRPVRTHAGLQQPAHGGRPRRLLAPSDSKNRFRVGPFACSRRVPGMAPLPEPRSPRRRADLEWNEEHSGAAIADLPVHKRCACS